MERRRGGAVLFVMMASRLAFSEQTPQQPHSVQPLRIASRDDLFSIASPILDDDDLAIWRNLLRKPSLAVEPPSARLNIEHTRPQPIRVAAAQQQSTNEGFRTDYLDDEARQSVLQPQQAPSAVRPDPITTEGPIVQPALPLQLEDPAVTSETRADPNDRGVPALNALGEDCTRDHLGSQPSSGEPGSRQHAPTSLGCTSSCTR